VASHSGITVLVLVGLVALGFSSDPGGEPGGTDTGAESGADDDFSFEPEPGEVSDADDGGDDGGDSAADDDFSFEPEPGAVSGTDDLSTCDDVAAVQSASGAVEVPSDSALFSSSASIDCRMGEGSGDDDAVAALQRALVRCNGQDIGVDGAYGPATSGAVTTVQEQHGLAADGGYDPEVRQAMQWPTGSSAGTTCVAGISLSGG
jgi:hypothetical protein